ncbi:stage V sporulation protein AB [Paenibacillus sp. N1-5-1-14]|nr:stage V sporulation protein AB [Paenibacillus radicibacter]
MLLSGFIGLAGGIAVGSGMVAFLVVLDIIPRLMQVSKSFTSIRRYEEAVVIGSLLFTILDFEGVIFAFPRIMTGIFGLFAGCFVGMLAAALTEVINVLPILAKRVGLDSYMIWFLLAMILGKVCGSLLEWLVF